MNTTHTPGPWEITRQTHGLSVGGHCSPDDSDMEYVCFIEDHHREGANSHLIAAAPDLLAALEGLLPMWGSGIKEPHVEAARAAIAKAKGE